MDKSYDLYGSIIADDRLNLHTSSSEGSDCVFHNICILGEAEALSFHRIIEERSNTRARRCENQIQKSTMMDRAGIYDERFGQQAMIHLQGLSEDIVPLLEDISHDLSARQ
jgi:hypothetical protein